MIITVHSPCTLLGERLPPFFFFDPNPFGLNFPLYPRSFNSPFDCFFAVCRSSLAKRSGGLPGHSSFSFLRLASRPFPLNSGPTLVFCGVLFPSFPNSTALPLLWRTRFRLSPVFCFRLTQTARYQLLSRICLRYWFCPSPRYK